MAEINIHPDRIEIVHDDVYGAMTSTQRVALAQQLLAQALCAMPEIAPAVRDAAAKGQSITISVR